MKSWLCLAMLPLVLGPGSHALAAAPPPSGEEPAQQAKRVLYDEGADARADIAAALARAKANNRRVLLQWGANWCGWCYKLDDCFTKDRDVRRKLLYEYDVVHVDVGKVDKNQDLAKRYGADLAGGGLPYLTVLDGAGEVLANQETGSLEEGKLHDPKKVLAFLEQHQAEPWDADELLAAALADVREKDLRLLVTFGAPW
jgi:thiol-disulfide isomerase/thioredoxin